MKRDSIPPLHVALQSNAELERGLGGEAQIASKSSPTLEEARQRLGQTACAQPALFAVSYALAELWKSWGIVPQAMIGHSIGEFVAATLAGVFSLEDALALVLARGDLMQQQPPGAMLAVSLSYHEFVDRFGSYGVELAAANAPSLCVVSGAVEAITHLQAALNAQEITCRRLFTSHAFHSAAMDPAAVEFSKVVGTFERKPPRIPFVSNVSGTWIEPAEATSPEYWARQLRQTVRFADGLATLMADPRVLLLEVGPGRTLSTFARQHPARTKQPVVQSMSHHPDDRADMRHLFEALGTVWQAGGPVHWKAFYGEQRAEQKRRRIPLPTYPFERLRCWVDPPQLSRAQGDEIRKKADMTDWFYVPGFSRLPPLRYGSFASRKHWVLFGDEQTLGTKLADELRRQGQNVTILRDSRGFDDLPLSSDRPLEVVYIAQSTTQPVYALLGIARALATTGQSARLTVVANGALNVLGTEPPHAGNAANASMLGLLAAIPQEFPELHCRFIDPGADDAIDELLAELQQQNAPAVVALRGRYRWQQTFEPARLAAVTGQTLLREAGTYVITGGLGRIGLVLTKRLLARGVRVVLVGRTEPQATEIEALGTSVLFVRADVADIEQMRNVFRRAEETFGIVHGVIHAAANTQDIFCPIQEMTADDLDRHFRPKVSGIDVLGVLLEENPIDFCVVFSSLAAILGGLGMGHYAAANAYMDAFVHARNRAGKTRWLSINWDGWFFAPFADEHRGAAPAAFGARAARLSMTPDEGLDVFERLLDGFDGDQVVVSTGDLHARLAIWTLVEAAPRSRSRGNEAGRGNPQAPDVASLGSVEEARGTRPSGKEAHRGNPQAPDVGTLGSVEAAPRSRPRGNEAGRGSPQAPDVGTLGSVEAAPRSRPRGNEAGRGSPLTPSEQALAYIWTALLGVQNLTPSDDFWHLGGHSLLGTQLLARIRKDMSVSLTLRDLFDAPTLGALTQRIESLRAPVAVEVDADDDDMEEGTL